MFLVLTADAVVNIPYSENLICLSVFTLKKLQKLGYQKVTLITLSANEKEILANYEANFAALIHKMSLFYKEILNDYHGMNFSLKAWQIIIGLWSYTFLCVCIDRYYRLMKINNLYPNIPILGAELEAMASVIPTSHLHFLHLIKLENYNAVLYTEISILLSMNLITRTRVSLPLNIATPHLAAKQLIAEKIKNALSFVFYKAMKPRAKVLLMGSYFPKNILIKLFIYSFGKILFVPKFKDNSYIDTLPITDRTKLSIDLMIKDKLLNFIISKLAPQLFPSILLEGFAIYSQKAKKIDSRASKVIFTASEWDQDSTFKLLAAGFHESARQIWAAPHGGGATFLRKWNYYAYHELIVSDRYYVPGLFGETLYPHTHKMAPPITLFVKNSVAKRRNRKASYKYFLYGLTTSPAFTHNFGYLMEDFIDYMNLVRRFLQGLDSKIQDSLLVRTHHEDQWWNMKHHIHSINKKLKIDSTARPFHESLYDSKLYICDHVSTTYFEALVANKPLVLFFDLKQARIKPEVEPYLKKLKDVGIYHETPSAAAAHVMKIQFDVNDWWFSKDVQAVKSDFVENFAYSSSIAFNDWFNVFQSAYKKN